MEHILEQLGFSQTEISTYLHLLKQGSDYPSRISFVTGTNRTNVYESLDRLVRKGLVSFVTRNKVKWFEVNKSKMLLSTVREREDELKVIKKELKKHLDNIDAPPQQMEASIFVGKKGIRMLFEEMLEVQKPIALIASQLQFKKLFGPYFELWHKKRIDRKILQRSIFSEKQKKSLKKRKYLQYKFVNDEYLNPSTTIIYGDTVVLIEWSTEPLAIRIQNRSIAKSHLNYFNMLWH